MKKLYRLTVLWVLLSFSNRLSAQCSVSIIATSNTTQLTCATDSIILKAHATGSGLITYSWSNGSTTDTIRVRQDGTYTVTITDENNCTSSSSIIITKDVSLPSVSILPIPDAICAGSTANLIAFGANTYTWGHTVLTGPVVQVSPETTTIYTVTGTAANGCTATTSLQVDVLPRPSGSISGTAAVCQNASQPPILFTGSGGTRPYTFTYIINGGAKQTIATTGSSDQVTLGAPTGTLDTLRYNLVSVADSNRCSQSQSGNAIVIVRPGPVFTSPRTASVCSDSLFKYDATSSALETSFSWNRAAVQGISNSSDSGTTATIRETLVNTSTKPVIVTYIFSLTTGTGCITQNELKVTVNPTPSIDTVTNLIVCNGTFVRNGINFSSPSTNATFTWTNNNINIGLPASGSGHIPGFIATNTSAAAITATITVSVSADGCAGQNRTFTITVHPGPALISSKTASVCDRASFDYTARSSAQGTSFTWERLSADSITGSGPTKGTTATISDTFRNSSHFPKEVVYVFTLSTGGSCISSDSVKVTVNPTPSIDTVANRIVCNGATVSSGINFSSPSPNATFTWTNSNQNIGLPASGSGHIPGFIATNNSAAEISATITVSVRASADGCAGQNLPFTIKVRPGPALISSKTASVCDRASFDYTARSSADNTSFSWERLSADSITGSGPTKGTTATISDTFRNSSHFPKEVVYVFTLSTGGSCDSRDSVKIIVNPTPVINFIKDTTFCNGAPVDSLIFFSPSPNAFFTWTNSNQNIGLPASGSGHIPGFIATNNSAAEISATITVSVRASADGCAGQNRTFTITVRPGPRLNSLTRVSVCSDSLFNYTATSTSDSLISYHWRRDVVTGISNAANSGNIAAIAERLHSDSLKPIAVDYVFTLQPRNQSTGCTVRQIVTLIVNPTPQIKALRDTTFCNGSFVTNGILFSSVSPDSSFTWTSSDTALSRAIGLPAKGTGSILPFNATNKTAGPITVTITVNIKASVNGCAGQSKTFRITVLPGPALISAKVATLCNDSLFIDTARSSAASTNFSWVRLPTSQINNFDSSKGTDSVIRETLRNTGLRPIVVDYVYTLIPPGSGITCISNDTLKVTVNPSPTVAQVQDKTFCNDSLVQAIEFFSSSNAAMTWISDTSLGFGTGGAGNIPAFITSNPGTSALTAAIKVVPAIGVCLGDTSRFTITVYPTPALTSAKTASVCDTIPFTYTARSSARPTRFNWRRERVAGISNAPDSRQDSTINETLHNLTTQPVVVTYYFTLFPSNSSSCAISDSLKVTVNPTPVLNAVRDTIFCNNFAANGLSFSSTSPDSSFTWTNSNINIGLPASGSGSIPNFFATNITGLTDSATIRVNISASANGCIGAGQTFKIYVNPSPPRPGFTSLSGIADTVALPLCSVSENINFNVLTPARGVNYSWSTAVPADRSTLVIRDRTQPNTVISFYKSGVYNIQVTARNIASGCTYTVSQRVNVNTSTSGIDTLKKIFRMQPGDLLVYPDNSLKGYQWGYDTINRTGPTPTIGAPTPVQGQVYQYFIPNGSLDTARFLYWVNLENGPGCQTRVYYNGPYANRRILLQPPVSSTVQLQVMPNPNTGLFDMLLSGNIYGKMEARIYNSLGHVVVRKNLSKTIPLIKETLQVNHLPAGLYFLEVQSTDLKKVLTRFVIQH